ncbi:SDR family oxidoreductase [Ruania halotolerans]|uniref:SDR family oxidoreductase n=1 Tax=Ruania halotolerans TaxID=2897773 RepID=UPI001E3965F3|nr:SDR family oxidoreductase [Ruania halotolerans]UFU07931.1 SDR family oxidoreductase [Ruania halotolerans]
MTAFDLHERVAVVTGASSGIGRAVALGLAEAGAHVLTWGRADNVGSVAEEIRRRGGTAEAVLADLSDLDAAAACAQDVLARAEVDILVNSAGIIRRGPSATTSTAHWREVLTVDLDATWVLCREFGARMLNRGTGKIINVASMLSFQGGQQVASYAAAKHGVVGLTKALANEWAGGGVNVNAIAPGYVKTANTAPLRQDAERSAQITARIPAGRWAEPEDMVGPAVFLASDAASYVHGHVLAVDGGWLGA